MDKRHRLSLIISPATHHKVDTTSSVFFRRYLSEDSSVPSGFSPKRDRYSRVSRLRYWKVTAGDVNRPSFILSSSHDIDSNSNAPCSPKIFFPRSSSRRRSIRRKHISTVYAGFDLRSQLTEQLDCLDRRLNDNVEMLDEIRDFFKAKARLEDEYSIGLQKLVRQAMDKHRQAKQKRENWSSYSTYKIWHNILAATKKLGLDHGVLSAIYLKDMVPRFDDIAEDAKRLHKKAREAAVLSHDDIIKVLSELYNNLKLYQQCESEAIITHDKLKSAEEQRKKLENHGIKGALAQRKLKNLNKQILKRHHKWEQAQRRGFQARNEYFLSLEAANSTIRKHYMEDLLDIIDCIDFGYHNSLGRSLMMAISAEESLRKSHQLSIELLHKSIQELDAKKDKHKFLGHHNYAFALPKKLEFQRHRGDEHPTRVINDELVKGDLVQRYLGLSQSLENSRLSVDELWKTLETADVSMMNMINQHDYDVTLRFSEAATPDATQSSRQVAAQFASGDSHDALSLISNYTPIYVPEQRSKRHEIEEYYFTKFNQYLMECRRHCRLNARFKVLQNVISPEEASSLSSQKLVQLTYRTMRKRRIGKSPQFGSPKLFGSSIDDYVEATGEEIPPIVTSCIRMINLHGMHHQGIFRVSGSTTEISEFRAAFEKGEDPFEDIENANMNSVAGLLKLYFRDLPDPLFPQAMFEEFINCSKRETESECIVQLRELLSTLSRPIITTMRYLFAFLSHLSEFSDENMMDQYNLSICFGPTLLPIPPNKDQVLYHNYVISLIKCILFNHETVFFNLPPPHISTVKDSSGNAKTITKPLLIYQKILSCEDEDEIERDEPSTVISFSDEEDDSGRLMEATARYSFQARNERELSFHKGSSLKLSKKVNEDWWEGRCKNMEGLIPAEYIIVRSFNRNSRGPSISSDDADPSDHMFLKPSSATTTTVSSLSSSRISRGPHRSSTSSRGNLKSPNFTMRGNLKKSSVTPSLVSTGDAVSKQRRATSLERGLDSARSSKISAEMENAMMTTSVTQKTGYSTDVTLEEVVPPYTVSSPDSQKSHESSVTSESLVTSGYKSNSIESSGTSTENILKVESYQRSGGSSRIAYETPESRIISSTKSENFIQPPPPLITEKMAGKNSAPHIVETSTANVLSSKEIIKAKDEKNGNRKRENDNLSSQEKDNDGIDITSGKIAVVKTKKNVENFGRLHGRVIPEESENMKESLENRRFEDSGNHIDEEIKMKRDDSEDLSVDIDNTLAEVMSELHQIEARHQRRRNVKRHSVAIPSSHPKHTPDLVLDLPISSMTYHASSSSTSSSRASSPSRPSDSVVSTEQKTGEGSKAAIMLRRKNRLLMKEKESIEQIGPCSASMPAVVSSSTGDKMHTCDDATTSSIIRHMRDNNIETASPSSSSIHHGLKVLSLKKESQKSNAENFATTDHGTIIKKSILKDDATPTESNLPTPRSASLYPASRDTVIAGYHPIYKQKVSGSTPASPHYNSSIAKRILDGRVDTSETSSPISSTSEVAKKAFFHARSMDNSQRTNLTDGGGNTQYSNLPLKKQPPPIMKKPTSIPDLFHPGRGQQQQQHQLQQLSQHLQGKHQITTIPTSDISSISTKSHERLITSRTTSVEMMSNIYSPSQGKYSLSPSQQQQQYQQMQLTSSSVLYAHSQQQSPSSYQFSRSMSTGQSDSGDNVVIGGSSFSQENVNNKQKSSSSTNIFRAEEDLQKQLKNLPETHL